MKTRCSDCGKPFDSENGRLTHQGIIHGTPSGRRVPRKGTCICPACGDAHRRLPKYVGVRTFDHVEQPDGDRRV